MIGVGTVMNSTDGDEFEFGLYQFCNLLFYYYYFIKRYLN